MEKYFVPTADSQRDWHSTKLRQWSVKAMESAMSAVKEGLMGINRAALEHDVPKTILKDHLSSRVQHASRFPELTCLRRSKSCTSCQSSLCLLATLVGWGPTIVSSWVSVEYPSLFHWAAGFLQCLIDQSDCCIQAEGRSYLVRLEPDRSCAALSTVTSLLSSGRSMVTNCLVEGNNVSMLSFLDYLGWPWLAPVC